MGVAFVTGMQGDDPKYFRTIATPKHFAVHSGPEPTRHTVDVKVSLHDDGRHLSAGFPRRGRGRQSGFGDVRLQPHQRRARLREHSSCCRTRCAARGSSRATWCRTAAPSPTFTGDISSSSTLAEAAAISLKKGTDNDCGAGDAPAYLEAMQKESDHPEGGGRQPQAAVQGALSAGDVRPAGNGEVRADSRRRKRTAKRTGNWR